jgi:hypothetical protein
VVGARNGRLVTTAVRSLVRPAMLWMRMVSMASARVMAGRMVVSRRASIDVPAPESARIPFCETLQVPPCHSGHCEKDEDSVWMQACWAAYVMFASLGRAPSDTSMRDAERC